MAIRFHNSSTLDRGLGLTRQRADLVESQMNELTRDEFRFRRSKLRSSDLRPRLECAREPCRRAGRRATCDWRKRRIIMCAVGAMNA